MSRSDWNELVEHMLRELRTDGPRAETYWAQQLAFGPVFVHAVRLRYRHAPPTADEARLLVPCARLAFAALGSLPEPSACDPTSLQILAARQARAVGWGRRATLARVLHRLGETAVDSLQSAPPRMARAYPLIGFRPGERLAG